MRKYENCKFGTCIVVALTVSAALPASAQEQTTAIAKGCALRGAGPDGMGGLPPLARTSGNNALDEQMHTNLNALGARFRVLPRFYFFDDGAITNAYDMPLTVGGPDDFPPDRNPFGSMLFGINLVSSELRATPQGAPKNYTITAIMAHELGHTLQFVKKSPLPNMHKELQADFLAGWAIRFLQRTGDPDIDEGDVFTTFYKKGDYAFNSPVHHGTKKERLAAFLAGYEVEDNDPNVAYSKAEQYVINTPPEVPKEFFARNLGAHYERIPIPDGTFLLRISRAPAADSPAGRGGIEEGDIIIALDALPFRSEEDVLNHVAQTTVLLIDVRTGQRQETVIEIR